MGFFSYKFRIYPTPEQANLIDRTIGCARLTYNLLLDDAKKQYETTGKSRIINVGDLKKIEGLDFLKEVDSLALCNSRMNLQSAYNKFFRDLKKGKISYPKFKSKKTSKATYTTNNVSGSIRFQDGGLRLPKLGVVKGKFHRFVEGQIHSVNVSRTKTRKYFVSILVDRPEKVVERIYDFESEKKVLGIDFSVPNFAVYSDGTKPKFMNWYRSLEEKLAKQQRVLSRRAKGSANYEKQRIKVARIHERISNLRRNFIESESTRIANMYDVVVLEDINLQGMSKGLHLGRSVLDTEFGMFRERLEQKLADQLKELVKADRWFASSKTCHVCGYRNQDLTLKDREWTCPECGTHLDRDYNAALNLRNYYLGAQCTEVTPVEIASVDDKEPVGSPKKHTVAEAGKIVAKPLSGQATSPLL